MYGIYANIWGILMVNVTIYGIHGSYGNEHMLCFCCQNLTFWNFTPLPDGFGSDFGQEPAKQSHLQAPRNAFGFFLRGEQPTKIGTMHCRVVLTSLHIQIFAHLKICTSRYLLTTYLQFTWIHLKT